MSDIDRLLPPNSTLSERAIETVIAERWLGIASPISTLWNADTCAEPLLPWMAWSFSVDVWDASWPEETKRTVIKQSLAVHRIKGTLRAVKDALRSAGYGDAEVIERWGWQFADATFHANGEVSGSKPDHWAEYRVVIERLISIPQAAQVRAILGAVAPRRCHLKALDFRIAVGLADGTLVANGNYSAGIA